MLGHLMGGSWHVEDLLLYGGASISLALGVGFFLWGRAERLRQSDPLPPETLPGMRVANHSFAADLEAAGTLIHGSDAAMHHQADKGEEMQPRDHVRQTFAIVGQAGAAAPRRRSDPPGAWASARRK
jgi:hypothetical protein